MMSQFEGAELAVGHDDEVAAATCGVHVADVAELAQSALRAFAFFLSVSRASAASNSVRNSSRKSGLSVLRMFSSDV